MLYITFYWFFVLYTGKRRLKRLGRGLGAIKDFEQRLEAIRRVGLLRFFLNSLFFCFVCRPQYKSLFRVLKVFGLGNLCGLCHRKSDRLKDRKA